ncbi:MAG TPA: GntR family transcriptional regulator [Opitutaceae bacterium]|nr:GntR family transcriptional regulator [Opitutaceae bacterium]
MARARRTSPSRKKTAPPAANGHRGQGILKELRERILNWHYPPGCHLAEQRLCEEFDSSRIPVREALRALAEQGLVDKVPNQGCYVKQPDVEGIHHLYDLRLALELFVVERLAQTGPPADLVARIRAYWEPLLHIRADEPTDGDILVQADEEFHLGLARAVGNPYVVDTLKDINERLRFVRLVVSTTPHRVQATAGEHLTVLEALVKKNVEAARRALRQNIDEARNKVEIALARALTNAHKRPH